MDIFGSQNTQPDRSRVRWRHTNIMDVRAYRGGKCGSDHQLVITQVKEKLSTTNRDSKGSK